MNTRKILLGAIILFFMMCVFPVPASATEYVTELPPDMDVDAVKEEVVSWVNTCDPAPRSRLITKDDVDLSKAFKWYGCNGEIFEISSNNFEEMKEKLEDTLYFFEVPVYLDGNTWIVGIMRGFPVSEDSYEILTKEEIAELESVVGKWTAFRIFYYESEIVNPYKTAAESAGITDRQAMLVGTIPNLTHHGVAIFPDEEGNLGKMVSATPLFDDTFKLLGIEDVPPSKVLVVDYPHAKEILEKMEPESDNFDTNISGDDGTGISSGTDTLDNAIDKSTTKANHVKLGVLIGGIVIVAFSAFGIVLWRILRKRVDL